VSQKSIHWCKRAYVMLHAFYPNRPMLDRAIQKRPVLIHGIHFCGYFVPGIFLSYSIFWQGRFCLNGDFELEIIYQIRHTVGPIHGLMQPTCYDGCYKMCGVPMCLRALSIILAHWQLTVNS